MADPLRSDASDNRLRILAAARVAFAAHGPDVPVRDIAERARVSEATVFRRFATKQALYDEAFAEASVTCSAIVEEGLAHPDPGMGLERVIEQLLETHARDAGFRAVLARPPDRDAVRADRSRAWRKLVELISRGQRAGALRQDLAAEDVVLALMANEGLADQPPEVRLAASRRLAALLLASFRAEEPGGERPLPPPARLALPPV